MSQGSFFFLSYSPERYVFILNEKETSFFFLCTNDLAGFNFQLKFDPHPPERCVSPASMWQTVNKLVEKADLVVVDDELHEKHYLQRSVVSLDAIKSSFKAVRWGNLSLLPSASMLHQEWMCLGLLIWPLLRKVLCSRAIHYLHLIISDALPIAKELTNLTGCRLEDTLSGKRVVLFESFIKKNPALESELLRLHNQPSESLKGGVVLNAKVGIHCIPSDHRVSILDFSGAYPSIGARIFQQSAPQLALVFQKLLKLRAESQGPAKEAVKLFSNALWGCLGSKFSRFSCQHMASQMTREGRQILELLRECLDEMDTVKVLGVWGTQFPITFEQDNDFTFAGRTLTLTSQVPAPQTGQTLWCLIETLFYG